MPNSLENAAKRAMILTHAAEQIGFDAQAWSLDGNWSDAGKYFGIEIRSEKKARELFPRITKP